MRPLRYRFALAAFLLAAALLPWISRAKAQAVTGPSLQTMMQGVQQLIDPSAGEPLPAPAEGALHLPLAKIAADAPIELDSQEGLISLSVQNASLRQVLSALAETQGLNLVIASPADAAVTAKFERVPLREVLAALLSAHGHTWTQQNGIIYVTSTATGAELSPEIQGRRIAVIELDFASAFDLQAPIAGLLSSIGQSFYVETNATDNRRTRELIIIEDLDPYVTRIEQYIAEADQPPRQVLIEVHLLQVDLDKDERTGVNFNALSRISGASLSLRSTGLANPLASPGFFIESTGGDLDSVIEALILTNDAKTLASPRILALNGQTSRMQIGERLGYRVTTTTETSSLESVNFLDVGVVLSVTPRVTRDGRVLMRIKPEVSTGAVNPDTGVPDSETTELETDVLLNSGQGMIVGGLIQERDSITISRVPVLGKLPYVNFLFQRRQVSKRRSELIIALVPHILPYEPIQHHRNAEEFNRAFEPLTQGPLCRYPRPYESRLPDPLLDKARLRCLTEADDPCFVSNGQPACEACNGLEGPETDCQDTDRLQMITKTNAPKKLRRLPSIASDEVDRIRSSTKPECLQDSPSPLLY